MLVTCPECGEKVSERAYKCPACGFELWVGGGYHSKQWRMSASGWSRDKEEKEQEVKKATERLHLEEDKKRRKPQDSYPGGIAMGGESAGGPVVVPGCAVFIIIIVVIGLIIGYIYH